jgi:hypothetical protein
MPAAATATAVTRRRRIAGGHGGFQAPMMDYFGAIAQVWSCSCSPDA